MKTPFYARYAWFCLALILAVCPVAIYGARQAVQSMKNDVRKWLPESFRETRELEWFRQRFIDEQFVVVSWPGCTGDPNDKRFQHFCALLRPAAPPSSRGPSTHGESLPAPRVAEEHQLYGSAQDYRNWGGQQEKWLRGAGQAWFYLTPDGKLYRWRAISGPGPALGRAVLRLLRGPRLVGEQVADLGTDGPWYYANLDQLSARLFKDVISGPEVLAQLTREGASLAGDPDEARRRLQGSLFGQDGKQTALVVTLTEAAQNDLHRVVGRGLLGRPRGRLLEAAQRAGIELADLHMGGPPVDNVAIDEEGSITLVRLIGLCIGVGLLMAYLCLRSVLLMFMVFIVGGLSALISMALVYWTGGYVDAVLMSMPALVYVLALSGAIHIVNYYRDAIAEGHDVHSAPSHAVQHGWLPCTLCAVTTALGMASLCTSEIQPIRNFGIYSALGVVVGLVVLLVYLPAALQVCPPRIRPHDLASGLGVISLPPSVWTWYADRIVRYRRWIFAAVSIGLLWLACGAARIQTSVEILKMFDARAKIIQDYVWLETHLGKLVPMELVLRVPQTDRRPSNARLQRMNGAERQAAATQLTLLDRMELVAAVETVIAKRFGPQGQQVLGQTLSATTFAPVLPRATGELRNYALRTALNSQLDEHLQQLQETDYLRIDPRDGAELWRVSLRLGALQNIDYGLFVQQLRGEVEPIVAAYNLRRDLVSRLLEARGSRGLAGASVGLVEIVPPNAAHDENASPSAAMSVGQILAGGPANADQVAFSPRQRGELLRALGHALRSSRLRVEQAQISAEQFDTAFVEQLAEFDAVVVSGASGLGDRLQQVQHPLLFAAAETTADTLDSSGSAHSDGLTAVYTGIVPLVYKAQRTLLENLIESSLWSGFLVSACMIVLLVPGHTVRERLRFSNLCQGFMAGLVSMLPNIFPLIVVFGAIGWLGISVDIGSMMTASVALGIAVDDTIHYLTWFRWALGQRQSRREAILTAYLRSGNSMIHTTIIGGLGMFVFAASSFTPTQRFGILMLTILAAAILGDLLWGPTLYAGFLGRFFHPAGEKPSPSRSAPPPAPVAHDSRARKADAGRQVRVDGPQTAGPASGPERRSRTKSSRRSRR